MSKSQSYRRSRTIDTGMNLTEHFILSDYSLLLVTNFVRY